MTINCTNCEKVVHMSGWGRWKDGEGWKQVWVHQNGFPSCYPRNQATEPVASPSTDTLQGYLAVYATPAPDEKGRVLLDLDMDAHEGTSPFIIVRHQGRVMILNPMALPEHLCVDAHAFVDGEDARTGVLAMEDGKRTTLELDPETGYPFGLSHRWPAAKLVALLLGDQAEE